MEVKRGDIFYADLSPVVGSEQGGIRPVAVIQNDTGNKYSPTVIVATITTNGKKFITHLMVGPECGLKAESAIELEQIRTIDKRRLKEKIGRVPPKIMEMINEKLDISFGRVTKEKGGEVLEKLTVINSNGTFAIDSREAAAMIGKEHAHLLRDIQGYVDILNKSENPNLDSLKFFIPSKYNVGGNNRGYPCYLLTRMGCDMVANKMTGEKGILFTAEYVTRFDEMEKKLKTGNSFELIKMVNHQVGMLTGEVESISAKISSLDEKVDNEIRITFNQAKEIQFNVSGRVIELLGGKCSLDYQNLKGSYFQQLHHDLKDRLGVPSYRDIRKLDYEAALAYIKAWLPKAEV